MTAIGQQAGHVQRLEVLLQRLPGSHGLGLIPWLVPLLFGVGTVGAVTTGEYATEWVRFGLLINVCAWLLQGVTLLIIRPRALGIAPTAAGGVLALLTFAIVGIVGAVVLIIGYELVSIPGRPLFFDPLSVLVFSVLTWVSVASIVALSYSWRDQLNDTLIATTAKLTELTVRSTETGEMDSRQRRVVTESLKRRVLPQLEMIWNRLPTKVPVTPEVPRSHRDLADDVEQLAQHEIRSLAHLLHPQGMALGLTPVLNSVANEFRDRVELRFQSGHGEQPVPPPLVREVAVTLTEILLDETASSQGTIDVVVLNTSQDLTLIIRNGEKEIVRVFYSPRSKSPPKSESHAPTHWFHFPPAAAKIPWLGISILNAFSVVVATLLTQIDNWIAAGVDISIITVGTFILFLLVRPALMENWSTTAQWIFVAAYVACLGAIAGAAWGAALGGEALSLAFMGLICALSVGLFAPARKVWASETKRLQRNIYLAELQTEYATFALQNVARIQRTAAADILHSVVQSRLLAIAGSIGGAAPGQIPQATVDALRHLRLKVLPELISDLAAPREDVTQSLLTQEVLVATWPGTTFSMKQSAKVPTHVEPLINGIVLEAIGNALVHGAATEIAINIAVRPAAIEVTVDDNGTGVAENARQGLGLQALEAAAPNLTLTPRPAGGSRLHLRVPFFAPRHSQLQSVAAAT